MYRPTNNWACLMFNVLVVALFILLPLQTVTAQTPTPQGPTDRAELEAFFDQQIAAQMKDFHIPGVTLSVVKNGEVMLAKGYGMADLDRRTPVIADKTMFRIASVTKLFTGTAVMQLVEQGRLDLNADVNTYLKGFQIPATYPQPITMTHLLSHTAGFEDRNFGVLARTPADLQPLDQWLATHTPARVRPPGELSAYSNYGFALAGYIVAQVSGVPYEQYIEDNILKPLGMQHSTARQPLPSEFQPDMASGYTYTSEHYALQPFQLVKGSPEGAISTTATDMARFMIARLQNGQYDGNRILQDATSRQMHSTLFRADPRVSGMAYAFIEGFPSSDIIDHNQRIIGHTGGMALTAEFVAMMELLPDQNLGIFMAFNSSDSAPAMVTLFSAFLDRYYAAELAPIAQSSTNVVAQASRVTGIYQSAVASSTTVEKVQNLFSRSHIDMVADGYLMLGPTRFVQIEPLLFRQEDSDRLLAFLDNQEGNITVAVYSGSPMSAIIRMNWYDDPQLHMILIVVCVALFLSAVIVSLASWMLSLRRKDKMPQPRLARLAAWTAVIMAILYVLPLLGIALTLSNPYSYAVGDATVLRLLLTPVMIAAVLTIGMVGLVVVIWQNHYWRLLARIHYTLVTLAAVVFALVLNYWNLLGWKF